VERGLKNPSIEALRRISESLNVNIMIFLMESNKAELSEKNEYKVIRLEDPNNLEILTTEMRQELLTPTFNEVDYGRRIIGIHAKLKKGESISGKQISQILDESLLVMNGSICLLVGDERNLIYKGDSVYINGGTMHNYINEYEEIADVIIYMIF
jgi:mannose-6-phosphate isomerase-like protein (cupin superfamily)